MKSINMAFIILLLPIFLLAAGSNIPAPILDYHFDACSWDDTTGEINDSANDNNATAKNGTYPISGKINNSADVRGDNYIELPTTLAIDTWSMSLWVKFPLSTAGKKKYGDNYYYVVASVEGAGDLAYLTHKDGNSDIKWGVYDNNQKVKSKDFPDNLTGWHHLMFVNNKSKTKLYIDGTFQNEVGKYTTGNLKYVATSSDDPAGQSIGAAIDEFKIYDAVLNDTQIQELYDNENAKDNYDGTPRAIPGCLLIADYHFDRCTWSGATGEVIDYSDNDNNATAHGTVPLPSNGKINQGIDYQDKDASIYIKSDQPIDRNNMQAITVMGWVYVYHGTNNSWVAGWLLSPDGEDNSGNSRQPALGIYLKDDNDVKFDLRNDGVDTKNIGLNKSSGTIGYESWHHIAQVVKGREIKLYIDGNLTDTITSDEDFKYNNGYFYVGSKRYKKNSKFDEVKIFNASLTNNQIQTIYNNESSHKNYDGSNRAVVDCSEPLPPASFFDVWDITRNINDRNISTKIAAQSFDLTLAALDEANNGYQDFNGTVCTQVVDAGHGNSPKSGWIKSLFTETNSTTVTYNIPTAIQNTRVNITWKNNTDTGCPLADEDNSTLSSDNFAVRPQKFIFQGLPSGKLIAEHPYTFQISAKDAQNNTTSEYNQSITPTSTLRFRENSINDGSLQGSFSFSPSPIQFVNGLSNENNLSFNDVAIVTLELNDTSWCAVDSDDTPVTERTIYKEQNLTFIPDHFNVNFNTPIMTNHLDGNFTYLSNDLNMSAWLKNLSVTVTAKGEHNATMTNYETPQSLFYANDINITTALHVPNSPIMISPPSSQNNAHLTFIDGVADLNYSDVRFNYPREYQTPHNPIMIDGSEANLSVFVADVIDTAVIGEKNSTFAGDATFYFGKTVTEDVKTGQNSVPAKTVLEIYSPTKLSGFEQVTENWYVNKEDNFSTIIGLMAKESRDINSATSAYATAQNLTTASKGYINFNVINTHNKAYKVFYHLNIPKWLWYSRYNDYNATENCSEHPCFEYIYTSANTNITGIKSGDFNGSAFSHDFNSSNKRKAIKLLR